MGFGLWGLLVGRVGLAVSVMAAMTLGIVVDDTIHFVSKYIRARREHDMPPPQAIRYTFQTVAGALLSTTIILTAKTDLKASSALSRHEGAAQKIKQS